MISSIPHKVRAYIFRTKDSISELLVFQQPKFSSLHKLEFPEFYHFSAGDPCELCVIDPTGTCETIILGSDVSKGHELQAVVPAGTLQGLRSVGKWSLVGTVMSPGFDFADLSLPSRSELFSQWPALSAEIMRFTKA